MAKIGEVQYYISGSSGGLPDITFAPWAGNIPAGHTPISREEFLKIYDQRVAKFGSTSPGIDRRIDEIRAGTGDFAPSAISLVPELQNFDPNASTPSEENLTPEARAQQAAQQQGIPVQVGGGTAYVPQGTAGAANLPNIGKSTGGTVPAPTNVNEATLRAVMETNSLSREEALRAFGIAQQQTIPLSKALEQVRLTPQIGANESIGDFTKRIDANIGGRSEDFGPVGQGGSTIPTGTTGTSTTGTPTGTQTSGGINPPIGSLASQPAESTSVPTGPKPTLTFPTPNAAQPAQPTQPAAPKTPVVTTDEERNRRMEDLKLDLLGVVQAPELPKTADEYARLRREEGVVNDEEELNALQEESMLIKQEVRQFSAGLSGLPEGGRIGAVSEAERNASFRLEGLAIREMALQNRINSKNAFIENMMRFTQQDFANAQNQYNSEFSKNLQMYNLVLQEEAVERDIAQQEKAEAKAEELQMKEEELQARNEAKAYLNTVYNMMQANDMTFDDLDQNTKLVLRQQEMAAGIPQGTFEVFGTVKPKKEILFTSNGQDASGRPITTIVYKDPETGGFGSSEVVYTGDAPLGTGTLTSEVVGGFEVLRDGQGNIISSRAAKEPEATEQGPGTLSSEVVGGFQVLRDAQGNIISTRAADSQQTEEGNTFQTRQVGNQIVEFELNAQGQVVNQKVVRTAPDTPSAEQKLSAEDLSNLGLPRTAPNTEQALNADLQSSTAPQWFTEWVNLMETSGRSISPQERDARWEELRRKLLTGGLF